ncbi:MAG: uncharacterized protein HW391_329 [Chloroflexi bacterium]|nr:uncharacterized protein [Chloroflexota bacterium]
MTEEASNPGADHADPSEAAGDVLETNVTTPSGLDASGRPWPLFAHGSEAEMARILDFYGVRWEYEPRTFPILWDLDGGVIESFSPDFHLPDMDLFLELTTLKQRLVRKKNRKLRRLRELYPDVRVKLFYARDFRAIMLKYGRLALVDSMSGTLGQVVPDRAGEIEPAGNGDQVAARSEPLLNAGQDPAPYGVPSTPATELDPGTRARRRGASRSRRRRVAAAARSAARVAAGDDGALATGMDEEDRATR